MNTLFFLAYNHIYTYICYALIIVNQLHEIGARHIKLVYSESVENDSSLIPCFSNKEK